MNFGEWSPIYGSVCSDMGIDPADDEASVRVLEAVTLGSDLDDGDCVRPLIRDTATVVGDAPCLEKDLAALPPRGCIICSGSAVGRLSAAGYRPDIVVTDLDGPIEPQIAASGAGAVTLIHAHGGNADLVRRYASLFRGKVVLTTQGRPRGNVLNFGGFTDGDRAVCLARHFGASEVVLLGFDFEHPQPKAGSDPKIKLHKLTWARKIICDGRHDDIVAPGR